MPRQIRYADEFVTRFKELSRGQQSLVEESIRRIISLEDPTTLAHHLERRTYFCNWSHRIRSNLIVVFGVSKTNVTFLSAGSHSQAYRPRP
ncbi:MAG: hypothetical protein OK456_08470 [Thaumarchaeota archaeon]|nr:hypothetical protein [Nitrososphaerota archaeon]